VRLILTVHVASSLLQQNGSPQLKDPYRQDRHGSTRPTIAASKYDIDIVPSTRKCSSSVNSGTCAETYPTLIKQARPVGSLADYEASRWALERKIAQRHVHPAG
jgi:hypothetical protein